MIKWCNYKNPVFRFISTKIANPIIPNFFFQIGSNVRPILVSTEVQKSCFRPKKLSVDNTATWAMSVFSRMSKLSLLPLEEKSRGFFSI